MDARAPSLVSDFYAAVNCGDLESARASLSADFVYRNGASSSTSEEWEREIRRFRQGFPTLRHEIRELVPAGDRVTVLTETTGTHLGEFLGHEPTWRSFRATAIAVFAFRDDAIVGIVEAFDTFSMLTQLGIWPDGPSPAADIGTPGPAVSVTLAEIRADPLGFLTSMHTIYGDYARYDCDDRPALLVTAPAGVQRVLRDRPDLYSKLATPDLQMLRPMLGDGLLTSDGDTWTGDRRALQAVFTPQVVSTWADAMVTVTERVMARWRRCEPGAPLDMAHELSRLTLEIAATAFFSTDLGERSAPFSVALNTLNEHLGGLPPGEESIDEFTDALVTVRGMVQQIVWSRRIYDPGDRDLLAALVERDRGQEASDSRVVDQAVTFLLAGHETTAKALSWVLALLDQHPRVRERVQAEVDAESIGGPPTARVLRSMPYTRAVVDEVLRMRPPVWLITRTALHDDRIGEVPVRAGTLIVISPYLLHRHPDHWPDADQFWPERFLGDDRPARHPGAYLPFGHGPRQCIGQYFAKLELVLVLCSLLSTLDFTRASSEAVEAEALVTMRPRSGLLMTLAGR